MPSIARVAVRAGVGVVGPNTQEVEHAAAQVFATAFQHALVTQHCSIAAAYCRGLGEDFPQGDRWAPVTAMAADLGVAFEAQ